MHGDSTVDSFCGISLMLSLTVLRIGLRLGVILENGHVLICGAIATYWLVPPHPDQLIFNIGTCSVFLRFFLTSFPSSKYKICALFVFVEIHFWGMKKPMRILVWYFPKRVSVWHVYNVFVASLLRV